jgi:uncharacterized protein GlcG (DUF336 family)
MAKQATLDAAERVMHDEDGRVVGGVGVSGGSPEEDHDVAAAGAAAF